VTLDRLSEAFDRLDDFVAVQQGGGITVEAVELLQLAAGIEDAERSLIRDRVAALATNPQAGPVLLGILVGLFAAEDAECFCQVS
jgi:hypothetical protein